MKHTFVDYIPEDLNEGEIYISIRYATASHNCCCGCGTEIVTPLTSNGWKLMFDGETISLNPSIGNQRLDCRSHYWIRRNEVVWVGQSPKSKIEEEVR